MGVLESVAKLIPQMTEPLPLAVFTIFVALFLVVKLVLQSKTAGKVPHTQALKLLNRILNIAGIIVALVVVLAFLSYLYVQKLGSGEDALRRSQAKALLEEVDQKSVQLAARRQTWDEHERLAFVHEPLRKVGLLLPMDEASERVIELSEKRRAPEITPLLLAVNEDTLDNVFASLAG